MTDPTQSHHSITPAQLSFLAIYNPSLGPTDDTFAQQLVFYHSQHDPKTRSARKSSAAESSKDEANERLRRIGLAQGLVDFAKTFSNGAPVNSAETEKSRIILHELEENWWILASIDLTRIPTTSTHPVAPPSSNADRKVSNPTSTPPLSTEYSSREVSPPLLLTQQIIDAHALFCLHHGPSLTALYGKLARDRFCSVLNRFWGRFAKTWDVLLHGNPAVEALSGIKLASGGELGFGVGEEDWGSSERAVLEDVARQTEGLVDIVVARFGEEAVTDELPADLLPWVGGGTLASVHDGIVFGGINGISRTSLQSVSLWMRHIYTYGDNAYGVRDNPNRERRRRRQRHVSERTGDARATQLAEASSACGSTARPVIDRAVGPVSRPAMPPPVSSLDESGTGTSTPASIAAISIPPPIVSAAEAALNEATRKADAKQTERRTQPGSKDSGSTLGIPDQYMKYLTLGLSTYAKSSSQAQQPAMSRASTARSTVSHHQSHPNTAQEPDDTDNDTSMLSVLDPMPDGDVLHARVARQKRQENHGHFIVGLKGDIDTVTDGDEAQLTEGSLYEASDGHRTILRTLYVTKVTSNSGRNIEDSDATGTDMPTMDPARLRVVIYARRPFLYCFLFEQHTSSLGYASFYHSLHRNLTPIHKQMLRSTQPSNVADRVQAAQIIRDTVLDPADESNSTPVYDLMYDPVRLTVHATVPNIPEPGSLASEGILSKGLGRTSTWSRLEALSVHSAMLNTLEDSKKQDGDVEKTSKTNRGWWIVWMKFPPSDQTVDDEAPTITNDAVGKSAQSRDCQIAFVVRKAADPSAAHKPSHSASRATSGVWTQLTSTLRSGEIETPLERLAGLGVSGGIGFDARRYVESLLSLNR